MRFQTLQHWLDWQETLHPKSIDLGLERVGQVADRLQLRDPVAPTITVAGTNGKGSVATLVAALLQAMGLRVGLFTSPHLLRYNERIRVNGAAASDTDLCRAFAAIDAARGTTSLSYFEFGTLAAVWLFREAAVDFQVLEVGLGGRLDAVNLWDADVAAITSVDLDHESWLGTDREQIGREKAGILRTRRPVVLGESAPPQSVLQCAQALEAPVFRAGRDFALEIVSGKARWSWADRTLELALDPVQAEALAGARVQNLATALALIHLLGRADELNSERLASALEATPSGRLQRLPGPPEWLLDVAHNAQAARELARWLDAHPVAGPVVAIVGMMADKQRGPMLAALAEHIDVWVCVPLPSARALAATELAAELQGGTTRPVLVTADAEAAMATARARAGPTGRVVVWGSFITVQLAMERLLPASPMLAQA